jgi:hypothetical protein
MMMLGVLPAVRSIVLSVGLWAAPAAFDSSDPVPVTTASAKESSNILSPANPIGDRTEYYIRGPIMRIVMGRGVEIDDSQTEHPDVKPVGVTEIFTPNTPEIFVVVDFLPSPFDIFRLVARFILEDSTTEIPVHVIRAQFKNAGMGGHLVLLMKQPPGGFPVGNYRLEIHDEDLADVSLMARARFEVVATNITPAPGAR